MVNVPSGVWIDEQGRIVRPAEMAYSKEMKVLGQKIGNNEYIAGLYDWVENGADSKYVMSAEKLREKLALRPLPLREADAHFKLAVYLHEQGDGEAAEDHWKQAEQLNPDSWNYHRQHWSFDPSSAMGKWFRKVQALGDEPYYEPIDLPE